MIPCPFRFAASIGALVVVLSLAPSGGAAAQGAAPTPHCRDILDRIDSHEKAHDWAQLLADGQALDRECGTGNDIMKRGALFAVGLAQLRTGHFTEALTAARQCEGVTGSTAFVIDCRLVEAESLDGLGRLQDEKAVLIAILDALPSRGNSKLRKQVSEDLAAIDPQAAKAHGHARRGRSHDRDAGADAKYFGTGFIVSPSGHIVTNWHVVAECGTYWTADGQKLSLLTSDKTRDLALLKSAQAPLQVAGLRAEGPKVGESVVVYGYPLPGLLASSGSVTTGIVSASAGLGDSASRFQISAPVQPGNSGGPVLDAEGRVIGVVQGKLSDAIVKYTGQIPQNVNFAITEAELLGFLKAAGVTPALKPEGPKAEVSDIAAGARGFITQIVCTPQA